MAQLVLSRLFASWNVKFSCACDYSVHGRSKTWFPRWSVLVKYLPSRGFTDYFLQVERVDWHAVAPKL